MPECAVPESPANFHHLFYHAFRNRELNAHILNPMTIKAVLAVEGKSDKADAINMARLAAHFRLRTSNMPEDMQREIRMNLRKWDADKAACTRASNSLRSLLTAYRIPIFRTDRLRKRQRRQHEAADETGKDFCVGCCCAARVSTVSNLLSDLLLLFSANSVVDFS